MITVKNAAAGFTLLELLVALAVFAVIGIAAYSGLQSVLLTQAAVERQAQRLKQAQMSFLFLERDLEQAVGRRIRDEFGQSQPAFAGDAAGEDMVTFTRAGWDNPLEQPRANLQRLSYRLGEDATLVRRYWNTLDRSGLGEARETVLLNGIRQAAVRFLDERNNWQSEWPPRDSETPVSLPRAVELTLVLDDWGGIVRLFRLPDATFLPIER